MYASNLGSGFVGTVGAFSLHADVRAPHRAQPAEHRRRFLPKPAARVAVSNHRREGDILVICLLYLSFGATSCLMRVDVLHICCCHPEEMCM